MFVKLLSGPNAGEMVEMKYADAKPLLDDGRAVYGYPPDPPAAEGAPKADEGLPRKRKKHAR